MRERRFASSKPMVPAASPSASITNRPKSCGSRSDRSISAATVSRSFAVTAPRNGSTSSWDISSATKSPSSARPRRIATPTLPADLGHLRLPARKLDDAGSEGDTDEDEGQTPDRGDGHTLAEEDRPVDERNRRNEVGDQDRA